MDDDIHVFICEDATVAKEIIKQYFEKGKVTYAASFQRPSRGDITEALDNLQEKE